jgi:hypothetical protein
VLAGVFVCSPVTAGAGRAGWQRKEVDWRVSGGGRIKEIYYPPAESVRRFDKGHGRRPTSMHKKTLPAKAANRLASLKDSAAKSTGPVVATVIDSPPVDGFIPWIAVSVTDSRSEELDLFAYYENSVVGNHLTPSPQIDYTIGLFDTGSSSHLMGYAAAIQAGLFDGYPDYSDFDYVTQHEIEITGVTGSVDAWVSDPMGLFIDGLSAIDSNDPVHGSLDLGGMMGESNVSILVGQTLLPDANELPTVVGSPLSVYFSTVFYNDTEITVNHNAEEYSAPDIRIYEHDDNAVPEYPNIVPLELRPLGGAYVAYSIGLDPFDPEFYSPAIPSIIVGNLSQSLFFVHSVDLYHKDNVAYDKDRFMLDTGAQVSVIGTRIAARLALDPADPNFEVPIQGVDGQTMMAPGFYIDAIEIPALGQWLSYTNVPVIWLDVASPEGGTLDGIIGMNLFVEYNMVLRGGGMAGQEDPALEVELIPPVIGDVAPEGGDRMVNILDLRAFAHAWLATEGAGNWNQACDLAPQPIPDNKIDGLDFAVLFQHWLEGTQQ